jgi:hypothetical protein
MPTNPPADTAFWVDEVYDREYASDRGARYGAYLRDRHHRFHDGGTPTSDPREFAALAFTIASGPIMSPGYVHRHPRIHQVSWGRDDEDRYAFDLDLATPLPAVIEQAVRGQGWAGWDRDWHGDAWWTPYRNDRPAAWTTCTVRIPLPADVLPAPAYRDGHVHVTTAKAAVAAVCAHLNQDLAGILTALAR